MSDQVYNFRNVILCNEIIQDITNKFSFIGYYTGNIVVSDFPAGLRLAVFLEVQIKKETEFKFSIYLNQSVIGVINGLVKPSEEPADADGILAPVILPNMQLSIEEPSELEFRVSFDAGEEIAVLKKLIELGEVKRHYSLNPQAITSDSEP